MGDGAQVTEKEARALAEESTARQAVQRLLEEGASVTAVTNLVLTLFGCFVAGWLGLVVAREVLGR